MTGGEDAAVDAMQLAGLCAAADRRVREPQAAQLRARDDAVLASSKRGDLAVERTLDAFCSLSEHFAPGE